MKYSQSDAYIIQRGRGKKTSRSHARRGAGILIAVLLLLTAAICLLVVFLPRLSKGASVSAGGDVAQHTYYFLCTAETENKTEAIAQAQYAKERGGAGYIYNDGKYRIVAAVYNRESDVKTLITVNPESFYFSLSIPSGGTGGDKAVFKYLTGEWFDTVFTAATELERGNITEAAAEHAVNVACDKLRSLMLNAENKMLKAAATDVKYAAPQSQSVKSYVRYVSVMCVLSVYNAFI